MGPPQIEINTKRKGESQIKRKNVKIIKKQAKRNTEKTIGRGEKKNIIIWQKESSTKINISTR